MIGVILARFQPIHNGHIALIRHALKGSDVLHIFIGSADKVNKRNPIPVDVRELYLNEVIKYEFKNDIDRIFIHRLNDLNSETQNTFEWGIYLYSHIVDKINNARFNLYYSDGIEFLTSWFYPWMFKNFISLTILARNSIEKGICATKVRELILDGKECDLKEIVPEIVIKEAQNIRHYIELTNYNQ